MADVSIGTARGVVRIDYESRGASKVTREFEQIKSQTESTATSFATWANKIGMGNAELQRLNQVQRAVVEAQKTANYFALQYDNAQRAGNTGMMDRLRMMKLVNESQKSLGDITKIATEANKRLPSEMARAGTLSAKAFGEAFTTNASAHISQKAGGMGNALGGAMGLAMKSGIGLALAGTAAAVAGVGVALSGGFNRLTSIDSATYKLQALGMSAQKVGAISKDAMKAVEDTQYSLDQAYTVAAGAVQAGIKPGEQLVSYLKDVQGLAAVTQMDLQTVGMLMNRVQTQGRVDGEILTQLEYVGVNIMPMLQKEYGKTAAEMTKMRENGEIDAKHFNSAISNNFGKAADIMGNSITAAIGNMNTAIKKVGAGLLAPLFAPTADGEGPSAIVTVIKGIQDRADGLRKWMEEHRGGFIDFWRYFGKAAIGAAAVLTGALTVIIGGFGYLVKAISWIPRAFANVADALGADGVAGKAYGAADAITGFGDDVLDAGKKVGGFLDTLQKGWSGLESWSDAAKNLQDKPFDEIEAEVPKLTTVTDALSKLGKTNDDLQKAIEGSKDEWAKFLKTLKDKGATQAVLDAVKNLRTNYENGGRAAANYAKALKQLGDSSVDASTKASALTKALQELNRIPGEGEDALAKWNEMARETTKWNANLADQSDITGNSLVTSSGKINTAISKNGSVLRDKILETANAARELAATGEVPPGQVWDKTREVLQDLAKQFGISEDVADRFINTYLQPKKEFEIQFLSAGKDDVQKDLGNIKTELERAEKDGKTQVTVGITAEDPEVVKKILESYGIQWQQFDPATKTAILGIPKGTDIKKVSDEIEKLFNADPSQLDSEIKVITTKEDIVNQINDGNPLKIPAVLDIAPPALGEDGKPLVPIAPPIPVLPPGSPTPPVDPNVPKPTVPTDVIPLPQSQNRTSPDIPDIAPLDQPDKPGGMSNLLSRQRGEIAAKLLAPNPILEKGAQQQGYNFGQAFAMGIRDSIPEVLRAALELATASTDPLGHSPAKIGPLSGGGWTYFRGRTYSEAYAEGIASGRESVSAASLSIAGSSTDPLTEGFAKMMETAGNWASLGRHFTDMIAGFADIAFNVLQLGNQLSNGRLFPKSYVKDPNAKKSGSNVKGIDPGAMRPNSAAPQVYSPPAGMSAAVTPSGDYRIAQSPSPYKSPRGDTKPNLIVLHTQEGNSSATELANDMLTNGKNLSYHYIVDKDGNLVVQAVDPKDSAWSVGPKANSRSINIAMAGTRAGDSEAGKAFTREDWIKRSAQIKTTAELAAQQGLLYGIPIEQIVGHNWVSNNIGGTDHFDPGPNFPWDLFSQYVTEAYNNGGKPSGTSNFAPSRAIVPGSGSRASLLGGGTVDYTKQLVQAAGMKPLYTPGEYEYGDPRMPQWAQDFAKQFGLQVSSSVSASGADSLHGAGLGFDFSGSREGMTKMAEYIQKNLAAQTLQLIYADSVTNQKYGIAGGEAVGPGTGKPDYYSKAWKDHYGHVHWGTDTPVGGGYGPLQPATNSSERQPLSPVPVTLGPNSIDRNSGLEPPSPIGGFDPANPLGLTKDLLELTRNDPALTRAFEIGKGLGANASESEYQSTLQHLDAVIADQGKLNTQTSKGNVDALNSLRSSIMSGGGMMEGMNFLQTAMSITSQVGGLVGDAWGIVDTSLKSIASTKEIGDTLVRGIATSEDIYNIIENIQSYIDLGKMISATVGDALALAGGIVGSASGGDPTAMGVSAALSAGSSVAGIVSQVYSQINAVIDFGQEVYRMTSQMYGRALLNWMGLSGASDAKYLLDELNGQLQVYASENPDMKTTFNTLARNRGQELPGRQAPTNNLYIYQGPGQDPRDTMNDAMFAVRSSGVGAFGYAT